MEIAQTREDSLLAGLIGQGIALSRTPLMQMEEARAQGLFTTYKKLDMDAPQRKDMTLAQMVSAAEAAGFDGLNITYPYKIDVIDLLDELSESARAVGAVNTVVFENGKRTGHNTDMWGFAESFRRGLDGADTRHALLLGAGGAGVAVAHALADCGVETLSIFDTDPARAEGLAKLVASNRPGTKTQAVSDIAALFAEGRPNGVVNCTPMGMAKLPGMAIDEDLIDADLWVADIVYFPLETQLIATARAKGCRVLPGSGMAVFQAVRAFELFTGRPADPVRMKATFDAFDQPAQDAADTKR
ncbi:shikimate dehydrogenase [Salipiger sp. PrR002]|uniref:shikimate dehydrogenase n=1 Tax=Salipiger sp. PrR002 TaxID=2706489 RepID=UPI0013BDBF76|nr:shikimate dehydrogenase [Salipiger sp. PrR002]NDV99899.1 shikimate dehydrogenase [Salipiger sp. PrR002]NDW56308.1 shikimate dehydrogenase [Salipiger sp. PrR004]